MAEFLLVHGSCHGPWCWRDAVPALEARGHTARTITLPGHADGRDPAGVTLAETAEAVAAASTPDTLIVGHSWGGFPISAAAEAHPERLSGLIYLCAYLPVSGMFDSLQVLLEQRETEQPVVVRRLLLGRNRQPDVIRIESPGHDRPLTSRAQ